MMRFLADECLNDNLVRGVLHLADADLVRARDVGLSRASDEDILDWVAAGVRVVISHDSHTMTAAAYERVVRRQPMPGLVIVPANLGTGAMIDELALIHQVGLPDDFAQQVRYLPLR